jgi:hypothetical protein
VNYATTWPDAALDRLTDAYLAARADGRANEFRLAVDAMEATLARDPASPGESRTEHHRVLFELPASLHYRIDEAARVVVILDVNYHPGPV